MLRLSPYKMLANSRHNRTLLHPTPPAMALEHAAASIILHVDLDCFYAAVEHVRLGIPTEQPLGVQQWEGLIAVNYAARAAGVVRHDRVVEALRKCPDLHLVHVETIGNGDGRVAAASRGSAKVSLERYRQASRQVFEIFHRFSDICERASIDEAYLDVTRQVDEMVENGYDWDHELQRLSGYQGSVHYDSDNKNKQSMIIEDGPLLAFNVCDRRLLAGAIIAERIRSTVRTELGYTCSVGIATNKLLAKIASARNKPDSQTLIPPRAVPGLMQTLPLKKIKLLGGKVGEELTEKWGCTTAGEAQIVSLAALVSSFGDRLGQYVWKAIRGIQENKVQEKQIPKSMLAAKSFQATSDLSSIRRWLGVLAEELSIRMLRDAQQNHRKPRVLQLYYRCGTIKQSSDHSKSCAMPPAVLQLVSSVGSSAQEYPSDEPKSFVKEPNSRTQEHGENPQVDIENEIVLQDVSVMDNELVDGDGHQEEKLSRRNIGIVSPEGVEGAATERSKMLAKLLQEAAFRLFQRIEAAFPCTRLAIAASGYQDGPAQGCQSIQHFFANASQGKSCTLKKNLPALGHSEVKDWLAGRPKGLLKYMSSNPSDSSLVESSCSGAETANHEIRNFNCREDALSSPGQVNIIKCGHDEKLRQVLWLQNFPTAQNKKADHCKASGDGVSYQVEDMGIPSAVKTPCQVNTSAYDETHSRTLVCCNQEVEGICDGNGLQGGIQDEVDLTDVDVEEQHQILKDIYKSHVLGKTGISSGQRNYVTLQESQVPKRRKAASCEPGQTPILKFFRSTGD